MPLFRQERCTPWAPIRCHADFTSHERQHHLAQHDKGYLKGFPGLTAQRVRCHIQINVATKKGHIDQTRQGQCSTQPNPTNTSNTNNLFDNNDALPDHINEGLINLVFMVIHDITGLVFSNQTSHFPITSNRGQSYLVIFYIYDANFIASVPIKN